MARFPARTGLALGAVGLVLALLSVRCGVSADESMFAGSGGFIDSGGAGGASGGDGGVCTYGEVRCVGTMAYTCDAAGNLVNGYDCAGSTSGDTTCVNQLGCVACVPGATACSNNVGLFCAADGKSTVSFPCDPVQGMECKPEACVGACTPDKLGQTNVGCEFWPTVTANTAWRTWFPFGVLVTNTTTEQAKVTLDLGGKKVGEHQLPAGEAMTIELPWVDALKGLDADNTGTVHAPVASVWSRASEGGGAYRLRSDQPVVVVQLNALRASNPEGLSSGCPADPESGECLSYSNDVSLLVPTTSLGTTHDVTGWHAWVVDASQTSPVAMGDLLAITAPFPSTTVRITPSSPALALEAQAPFVPGATTELLLQQGDVLELFTDGTVASHQWAGATVEADRPVQLISGSPCAAIPAGASACDHLEEWVPPSSMLGKRYLATAPVTPAGRMSHVLRLHGLTDGTVVSFDPPAVHKAVTLNRGESIELELAPSEGSEGADVLLTAQEVFGLTQYMPSGTGGPITTPNADLAGPSQSVVVPVTRYLKGYVLALPAGFTHPRINVVASTGSSVTLDGEQIPSASFTAIGASGLSVARLDGLKPGSRHELQGEQPIGAVVYGYGRYTSYMYPAGMDLRTK